MIGIVYHGFLGSPIWSSQLVLQPPQSLLQLGQPLGRSDGLQGMAELREAATFRLVLLLQRGKAAAQLCKA